MTQLLVDHVADGDPALSVFPNQWVRQVSHVSAFLGLGVSGIKRDPDVAPATTAQSEAPQDMEANDEDTEEEVLQPPNKHRRLIPVKQEDATDDGGHAMLEGDTHTPPIAGLDDPSTLQRHVKEEEEEEDELADGASRDPLEGCLPPPSPLQYN